MITGMADQAHDRLCGYLCLDLCSKAERRGGAEFPFGLLATPPVRLHLRHPQSAKTWAEMRVHSNPGQPASRRRIAVGKAAFLGFVAAPAGAWIVTSDVAPGISDRLVRVHEIGPG
jgi:hypothetical protein